MNILWNIWEILINCLECFFFFYLLQKQLGFAGKKKIAIYHALILLILCETLLNFSNINFIYTMVAMLVLRVLCAVAFFHGSLTQRLLWGVSGTIVTTIANLLISNILPLFSGINIVDTLTPSLARFGVQIFYILIVITLFWILSRIPKRQKITLPLRLQILTIVIMILGVFTVGEIVGFSIRMERTPADRQLLVIISLAILVMLIVIVLLFDRMGTAIMEKSDAEHLLQISRLEEESVKKSQEMIATWNHDTKNFIEILQYHANQGDLDNLKKHLGNINKNFESVTALQSTGSSSIDASIASKLIVAHSKDIPFTLNISEINNMPLKETEMCIVLVNILNNAIEACDKIDRHNERYIDLSIYQIRDIVHIDVLNSSNGEYCIKNRKFLSQKSEPNHGLGLTSIERYLKKYNCFYQINHGDDYFEIKLFIPTDPNDWRKKNED